MDSRYGLDYIVEDKEYISKLASALDTKNLTIKKQVFELLSALCVYNSDGYTRALDALEHYKILKQERYRFKIVVSELKEATSLDYATALIAFVNCVIISTTELKERIRIRNEFIGLKILDVLSKYKDEPTTENDLSVQIDVFDEQRETDDAQTTGPSHIDLSSHVDIFYAILRQVVETPQEIPFLSILQHLLSIDSKEPISDVIWDTAERLLHRASLMEHDGDRARLLRAPSHKSLTKIKIGEGRCLCSCHRDESKSRKHSLNLLLNATDEIRSQQSFSPLNENHSESFEKAKSPPPFPDSLPPPPPPPPPPPGIPGPPPPPPPPSIPPPPPPPGLPGMPKIGNSPPMPGSNPNNSTSSSFINPPPDQEKKIDLPQMLIPKPKTKMKTFNWNKISKTKIFGTENIWSVLAKSHKGSPSKTLDWDELEGLFCQQPSLSAAASPAPVRASKDAVDVERKKKEEQIILLDGKRSLNINIFLKQFRVPNEEIMNMIRSGEHSDIGAEKLRGLLKLLPEKDEQELLRNFTGDVTRLAKAEMFLLQLMNISQYKLRIEALLLKEEFESTMEQIEPSVNAIIYSARDLLTNAQFHEVLYMVLVAGNFLNNGGYAGDAAGMKLSSLQKLTDIRANKPGMNLLHYVVQQAEQKNPKLLAFPNEMSCLEEATKTTTDQLQSEMKQLSARVTKLSGQLKSPDCIPDIKKQMGDFLETASADLNSLSEGLVEVAKIEKEVADYFCEDSNSFKIEECFKIIMAFCNRFRQATFENERRKKLEKEAEMRRRNREGQNFKRKSSSLGVENQVSGSYSGSESDNLFPEIQPEITQRKYADYLHNKKSKRNENIPSGVNTSEEEPFINSPRLNRRRVGSFSSPTAHVNEVTIINDNSPDITPNGSLRRRRSRVPSEEDDHKLMSYLETSGHNGSRERKTLSVVDGYGSLDRSLTKRSRTGNRYRSALLTSDSERERPSSPSAVSTSGNFNLNASQPIESNRPSKNWRKKIEHWFQDNEKEEKKSELKRRLKERRKSLDLETSKDNEHDPDVITTEYDVPQHNDVYPDNSKQKPYRRVYTDWKPSIEKTDVLATMEAIEEAQAPTPVKEKDKSQWRKSYLNVSNSCEATTVEDTSQFPRRFRRNRSKSKIGTESIPEALTSSDSQTGRSSLIQNLGKMNDNDTLKLYIRRPSQDYENNSETGLTSPTNYMKDTEDQADKNTYQNTEPVILRRQNRVNSESMNSRDERDYNAGYRHESNNLPPSIPRHMRRFSREEEMNDNDIDSENVETPPVIRKLYHAPYSNQVTEKNSLNSSVSLNKPIKKPYVSKSLSSNNRQSKKIGTFGFDSSENDGNGSDTDENASSVAPLANKKSPTNNKDDDYFKSKPITDHRDFDEELGVGDFKRFSSLRKTLRHRRIPEGNSDDRSRESAEQISNKNINSSRNSIVKNDLDVATTEDKEKPFSRFRQDRNSRIENDNSSTEPYTNYDKLSKGSSLFNEIDSKERNSLSNTSQSLNYPEVDIQNKKNLNDSRGSLTNEDILKVNKRERNRSIVGTSTDLTKRDKPKSYDNKSTINSNKTSSQDSLSNYRQNNSLSKSYSITNRDNPLNQSHRSKLLGSSKTDGNTKDELSNSVNRIGTRSTPATILNNQNSMGINNLNLENNRYNSNDSKLFSTSNLINSQKSTKDEELTSMTGGEKENRRSYNELEKSPSSVSNSRTPVSKATERTKSITGTDKSSHRPLHASNSFSSSSKRDQSSTPLRPKSRVTPQKPLSNQNTVPSQNFSRANGSLRERKTDLESKENAFRTNSNKSTTSVNSFSRKPSAGLEKSSSVRVSSTSSQNNGPLKTKTVVRARPVPTFMRPTTASAKKSTDPQIKTKK